MGTFWHLDSSMKIARTCVGPSQRAFLSQDLPSGAGRRSWMLGQSGDGAFSDLISKTKEHSPDGESLRQSFTLPRTGSTRVQGSGGSHWTQ